MNTLKRFQQRSDVRICKADKNLGPVLLSANQYHQLAIDQLPPSHYIKITISDFNPNRIFAKLRLTLHKHNLLYQENSHHLPNSTLTKTAASILHHQLSKSDQQPLGIFYILIKIHKPKLSGRPIVASYNSATYYASKFLDFLLQPLRKLLPTHLNSSTDLLLQLPVKPVAPNTVLLTADIISLYPSIPHAFGLHAIKTMLTEISSLHGLIFNISLIIELLEIILYNNYFSYNGDIYLQLSGTAMGTPIAVVYADFTVAYIESRLQLPTNTIFYRRYIDDIFIIATPEFANSFYLKFNQVCPDIQLDTPTIGNSVPFLDLTIYIDSSMQICTKTFQKAINQYLYIPPYSSHQPSTFSNLIHSELKRYRITCSSDLDFYNIAKLFYNRLVRRGYTLKFLNKYFQTSTIPSRQTLLHNMSQTKAPQQSLSKWIFCARVPNPNLKIPWFTLLAPTNELTDNQIFQQFLLQSPICIGRKNYPTYGSFFIAKNFLFNTTTKEETDNK